MSGGGHNLSFSPAFTLAEVLITLGIIGIVAALTIPSLTANHRKKVLGSKLKKFYSIMSQAVIMSEAEQGASVSEWDTFSSNYNVDEMEQWFNKYLKDYLNIIKQEKKERFLYVALSDGTGFRIFNHMTSVEQIHLYFCTDYSKCSNLPDGKYVFTFRFINNKFATYMEGTTMNLEQMTSPSLSSSCSKETVKANREAHFCSTLLQKNNWEVPDYYPIKL